MTCQQREEYIAPVCEVMAFEAEEEIMAVSTTPLRAPVFQAGFDATQDDDDDLW